MAELLSVCYVALFAASGIGLSRLLFYREKPLVRIWLGLAFGMRSIMKKDVSRQQKQNCRG